MSPQTIDLDETLPVMVLPYRNAVSFTRQPSKWQLTAVEQFHARPAGVPKHAVAFKWSNGIFFWGWN